MIGRPATAPEPVERLGNTQVEKFLLGSILLDSGILDDAAARLAPADFLLDGHRMVFSAMLAIRERGEPVEIINLAEAMERRGDLERVGRYGFLADLSDGAIAVDPTHYVELIRGYARRRRVAAWAQLVQRTALDPEATTEDLDVVLERPGDVEEPGASIRLFADVARERIGELLRAADVDPSEGSGLSTGIADLDRMTAGVRGSEFWVVGAIPGAGKTALLGQIAHHCARRGRAVGVFSLEMSSGALLDRMTALELGLPLARFREPWRFSDADRVNLIEARDTVGAWPIAIDDTAGLPLSTLKARARLMQRRHGIEVLVVDYLQLVRGEGDTTRERVSDVARGLKNLAKELGIAVLAASQLSRPPKGSSAPPTMLDLKESGEIEAAADAVILIHRPGVLTQDPASADEDRLIIGKNRHGITGPIPIVWDGPRARFLPKADGDAVLYG